jgi:thiol-disulfide isomerase/thioredoxin
MVVFRNRWIALAGVVALLLSTGCQPSGSSPDGPPRGGVPGGETAGRDVALDAPPSEDAKDEVSVQIASWDEVQQMVAALRGQVVVLDVWSTWCVPCTVEFPHLVKLQEAHPEGLACISVAANYSGRADEPPESFREEILDFLRRQNAAFANVISSTPDEALYEAIGAASVPVVLVYGRDGKLKKKFTNDDREYGDEGFTYAEHINPMVQQLLKEPE